MKIDRVFLLEDYENDSEMNNAVDEFVNDLLMIHYNISVSREDNSIWVQYDDGKEFDVEVPPSVEN